MRGGVRGLRSPHPLADTLPALLREDGFARDVCDSVDDVLAPVLLSLDAFACHLDPATAPDDVLPWLAAWLGLNLDGSGDPAAQRHALLTAVEVNALRGTRRGLELSLAAALGMPVEILDSGGARWSPSPGADLPGEAGPAVTVVVRNRGGGVIDTDRLDALIRGGTPAHVAHRVEIRAE